MVTSIVILTYNKLDYTKQCIESIRNYTKENKYEIIVVDNCSNDGTRQWIKEQKDIKVIYNDKNLGFPKGCNQGINIASGDDILLLNNDVIVTSNWLTNMTKALYSTDDVGAVGAVSNNVSYYQQIDTDYNDLKGLCIFAEKHNISDPTKWENRIKLVGFCMLIKRNVLDKVGFLDERFTPGNFEDDDLSLRVVNAGYRLLLCKDTFIHHYGSVSFSDKPESYRKLLRDNQKKIDDKFGTSIIHIINLRKDISSLIKEDRDSEFNVLQIECGGCATLMDIKNKYHNCKIFGIEEHEKVLINKSLDVNVTLGDIENVSLDYKLKDFDYIIASDIGLDKLIYTTYKLKKYLKYGGKLILTLNKNEKDIQAFIELLPVDFHKGDIESYDSTNQYILTLKRTEKNDIDEIIDKLECGIEVESCIDNIEEILNWSNEKINEELAYIYKYSYKGKEVLNFIGIKLYERCLWDLIIPVFRTVLDFEPNNKDAILNLAIVLSRFKQYKLSLEYIDKLYITDDEIYSVRKEILDDAKKNGALSYTTKPLISICIPTYNRAKNLKTCLNSICRQIKTWMDIEIVVVNNDATDITEEVVMEFKNKYDNIVYVKNQTNIGGDRNIARIPRYASGEFLFLHGDDDYFTDGSLIDVYNFVKDNQDNSFIFFEVTKNDKKAYTIKSIEEFIINVTGTNSAFMSCIMMKKCIYDKVQDKEKFIDLNLNQIYVLLSMLEIYPKACIVNYSLYWYENNLSGGYNWPKVFIENYLKILNYFADKNSISKPVYDFEKERVLRQSALNWLVIFKKMNRMKEFQMHTLREYVDKYYENEAYYYESCKFIDAIIKDKIV